ncbi:MAG: CRISPR-associated endonuclease Cas3'', partial [Chloroflexota bacterium]
LEWRAPVAAWQEMVPWIRGWGADVEVVEPTALRRHIEEHVRYMSELYGLQTQSDAIAYAHSRNQQGERHPLVAHLEAVATMAAEFAEPLQAPDLAYTLGLWHDLGKFHPSFQEYLRDVDRPGNRRRRGPDHKAAGVRLAREQKLGLAQLVLQGHHGGLKHAADLNRWYEQCKDETDKALTRAGEALTVKPADQPSTPDFVQNDAHSAEFFLRMLFSALVDADFLDTEAHFNPARSARRGAQVNMATLWQRFEEDQRRRFQDVPDTIVNRSRQEIYRACLEAASQQSGLFRLTVPTGGGKTRSGMAFALRHALEHGQRRVVVAVPYITITQQTAGVYRQIFDAAGDEYPAVLEHHSSAAESLEEMDDYDPAAIWQRLSAENWDAPIIVTTTVQLFESLFDNRTSRCRKLHRLANSVIILDEAQSLPLHLLDPILDGLRELCAHYGSTVVLSTATQPAFDSFAPFKKLNAREIVPSPERHFQTLKRVHYEWRVEEPLSWREVAGLMRKETQAMAICNTKQDALDLLDALGDPHALHLSTLLCGQHRSAVIKEVERRLKDNEPCRLVATQVVEAGVDIDFPLVLRALGPLDSIVQAAGRSNREGKLDRGRLVVFQPADGGLPPGAYARATNTTQTMLNAVGPIDMHDPATLQQYYQKWYPLEDTDKRKVQRWRERLHYPEVAQRFRMIKDDTVSVVVTAYGTDAEKRRVRAILDRLRHGAPPTRQLLRQLQPYTVSLWKYQADDFLNRGFLSPRNEEGLAPGLWEWQGDYDEVCGLRAADLSADKLVF